MLLLRSVVIGGNSAVQQFTRIGRLAMIGGMTGVQERIPFGQLETEITYKV